MLHGTGFGVTVTLSAPGPLGAGAGPGAGAGAGAGEGAGAGAGAYVGVGAVGEGSTLPQLAPASAATQSKTIELVRSDVGDFITRLSPRTANVVLDDSRHTGEAKGAPSATAWRHGLGGESQKGESVVGSTN